MTLPALSLQIFPAPGSGTEPILPGASIQVTTVPNGQQAKIGLAEPYLLLTDPADDVAYQAVESLKLLVTGRPTRYDALLQPGITRSGVPDAASPTAHPLRRLMEVATVGTRMVTYGESFGGPPEDDWTCVDRPFCIRARPYLPHEREAGEDKLRVRGGEFAFIGQGLTEEEFTAYVQDFDFGVEAPDYVVIHHTANPGATWERPGPGEGVWDHGEDKQGMSPKDRYARRQARLRSIMAWYRDVLGWSTGPHLFIDDRWIWLFTPMDRVGTHAKMGGNAYTDDQDRRHRSIGIEVVGNYSTRPWPEAIRRMVGHAVAVLKRRLGTFEWVHHPRPEPAGGVSFHRDYNKPACPGEGVSDSFILDALREGEMRLQQG